MTLSSVNSEIKDKCLIVTEHSSVQVACFDWCHLLNRKRAKKQMFAHGLRQTWHSGLRRSAPSYTNAQPITRSYFMKLIRKCFISHMLHLHPDIGHWEALQVIKEPPATSLKSANIFQRLLLKPPPSPFVAEALFFFFSRSRRVKSGCWMHRPAPQNQYRSHSPHWNVFLHI